MYFKTARRVPKKPTDKSKGFNVEYTRHSPSPAELAVLKRIAQRLPKARRSEHLRQYQYYLAKPDAQRLKDWLNSLQGQP